MSDEVKFEKNIPIPVRSNYEKYSFRQMHIGDSFTVEVALSHNLRQAASHFARRNPLFKFTTRIVTEDDTQKIRIWRIE